jgi:hypothetical protein
VTARGWRGEAEVHRQQLLEWFGASPAQPLKGMAGGGDRFAAALPLSACVIVRRVIEVEQSGRISTTTQGHGRCGRQV